MSATSHWRIPQREIDRALKPTPTRSTNHADCLLNNSQFNQFVHDSCCGTTLCESDKNFLRQAPIISRRLTALRYATEHTHTHLSHTPEDDYAQPPGIDQSSREYIFRVSASAPSPRLLLSDDHHHHHRCQQQQHHHIISPATRNNILYTPPHRILYADSLYQQIRFIPRGVSALTALLSINHISFRLKTGFTRRCALFTDDAVCNVFLIWTDVLELYIYTRALGIIDLPNKT